MSHDLIVNFFYILLRVMGWVQLFLICLADKGLEFMVAAASQKAAFSIAVSKGPSCLRKIFSKIILAVGICLSQTPPWLLALGVFITNSMLCSVKQLRSVGSVCDKSFTNSLLTLTKSVPLSQYMLWASLRMHRKHLRALMKESVDMLSKTSRCTARLYMQVKRRPYLYSSVHLPLRWKGPKQSIPM